MSFRLGVDVGGTFTDVLLVEEASGSTWRAKTASTPADQADAVITGIAKVCAEEIGAATPNAFTDLSGYYTFRYVYQPDGTRNLK